MCVVTLHVLVVLLKVREGMGQVNSHAEYAQTRKICNPQSRESESLSDEEISWEVEITADYFSNPAAEWA